MWISISTDEISKHIPSFPSRASRYMKLQRKKEFIANIGNLQYINIVFLIHIPFSVQIKQESGYTCQRFLFLGLHVTWSKNFLFYLSYKMRIRSVLYLKGAFCFKGNVINFLHCKGNKICHGISHLQMPLLIVRF